MGEDELGVRAQRTEPGPNLSRSKSDSHRALVAAGGAAGGGWFCAGLWEAANPNCLPSRPSACFAATLRTSHTRSMVVRAPPLPGIPRVAQRW